MHRPSDWYNDNPIHFPTEDGPVDYGGLNPLLHDPGWNIRNKIDSLAGKYGGPEGDILPMSDGVFVQRLSAGAQIWWSIGTGANVILGAIYSKWLSLDRERSFLGLPIGDELNAPGGGRFNNFQGGSIYWHPTIGAFEVHGAIRDLWLSLGGPGTIGYPTTDELDIPSGRVSCFKVPAPQVIPLEGLHSKIFWWPDAGAHVLRGDVLETWEGMGSQNSFLRRPLSEHVGLHPIRFERGTMIPREGQRPLIIPDSRVIDTGTIHLDGVAANGRATLMINSAGRYNFRGKVRATGALSYDFSVVTALAFADAQGVTRAFSTKGDVEGTLTLGGNREHKWDFWGSDSWIAENWGGLVGCASETRLSVEFNESNLAGHIGTILGIPFVVIGTIVGGAAGGEYMDRHYDWCGGVDSDGSSHATLVDKGGSCPAGEQKQPRHH